MKNAKLKDTEIVNRNYIKNQLQSYLLKRGINVLLFCGADGVALQNVPKHEYYYCVKCGRKWFWR